jgi:Ala-tRNA(Pro) deacylase
MLKTTCLERLEWYLGQEGVPYRLMPHRTAYTAARLAEVKNLPCNKVVKVVLAKGDRGPLILVLPTTHEVDLARAADALRITDLQLAHESELAALFPDCEVGAMPPFGNLYCLPVYVDESLADDAEITFPAGRHDLTLTVSYRDFARLVRPLVASFARILPHAA